MCEGERRQSGYWNLERITVALKRGTEPAPGKIIMREEGKHTNLTFFPPSNLLPVHPIDHT